MNPTVHVLDDDSAFYQTIHSLLNSASVPCSSYRTFFDFEQHEAFNLAGCLILDLCFDGMRTSRVVKTLRSRPDFIMPIIILTGHGSVPAVVEYMHLGAFDFLEKSASPPLLLKTIKDALAVSSTRMTQKVERTKAEKLLASLTTREKEIASLVCNGHSSREIATELDISINTVANHRASALAKLEAQSSADLLRILQLTRGKLTPNILARPVASPMDAGTMNDPSGVIYNEAA